METAILATVITKEQSTLTQMIAMVKPEIPSPNKVVGSIETHLLLENIPSAITNCVFLRKREAQFVTVGIIYRASIHGINKKQCIEIRPVIKFIYS